MTDHANELRRYARKIGYPAGDVPSVMLAAADEIERLHGVIEAMEQQEPVAWLHESRRDSDVVTSAVKHVWGKVAVGSLAAYSIPLYLAPGAKGEHARSRPGGQAMTDHAHELRRYARKIAHPAGDVPAVMRAAADEIIEFALQCGVWIPLASGPEREQTIDRLLRLAALVASAEREACAEIADEYEYQLVAGSCARDIRARGDA